MQSKGRKKKILKGPWSFALITVLQANCSGDFAECEKSLADDDLMSAPPLVICKIDGGFALLPGLYAPLPVVLRSSINVSSESVRASTTGSFDKLKNGFS